MAEPDVEIVQTSVPGEGDTGFRTILSALNGQPANSATHDRSARPGRRPRTRSQSQLSDALAPIKADGYDVSVAQTAGFTNNGLNIVVSGPDTASVAAGHGHGRGRDLRPDATSPT